MNNQSFETNIPVSLEGKKSCSRQTYLPEDSCNMILSSIRNSNLHFMVQESPYSVYVTLRKKFSDKVTRTSQTHFQKTESSSSDTSKLTDIVVNSSDHFDATKALLNKKEEEYLKAQDLIKILESKLDKSEAALFKESNKFKASKDELNDEIKILKQSIKKSNAAESDLKRIVKSTDFFLLYLEKS